MNINDRIKNLKNIIEISYSNYNQINHLSKRLLLFGTILDFQQINKLLEDLSIKLDTELDNEVSTIDFDKWLETDWYQYFESSELILDENSLTNHPTIISPCSIPEMTGEELKTLLLSVIKRTRTLLREIKKKINHIPDSQYEKYWFDLRNSYKKRCKGKYNYEDWKDKQEIVDLETLKDKQMQEILAVLKTGVFSYTTKPSKRQINNSIIKINLDSLESRTEISDEIYVECARMSAFTQSMEQGVCQLNYKKLGKYIFKHHDQFTKEQICQLVRFDVVLNLVVRDMVDMEPSLEALFPDFTEKKKEDSPVTNLLKKLIPFFKTEKDARYFLVCVSQSKRQTDITQEVARLVKQRIISEDACHRRLYEVLKEANIYTRSESNWNNQIP